MSAPQNPVPTDVGIRDESIRLGQFLKLANLVDDGAAAKTVLGAEEVTVNGALETRRGRQLVPGDVITLAGQAVRVVSGEVPDNLPW